MTAPKDAVISETLIGKAFLCLLSHVMAENAKKIRSVEKRVLYITCSTSECRVKFARILSARL